MILLIGPLPNPIDGCSFANFTLFNNLKRMGFEIQSINTNTKVISSKQGNSFSINKVFLFFKSYFLIYKVLFAKKVYVTPGQTFYGLMKYSPFLILSWLLRKPYYIHLHGNYLGVEYLRLTGIKKILFSKVISKAHAGIVLSESLRFNFKGLLPDKRVFVVYNFVEDCILEKFAKVNSKPNDKLRILFLSNLIEEKGILDLLKACVFLLEKRIDFVLTVAGGFDENIREKVEVFFRILGPSVEYLGIVSDDKKAEAFESSNIFVLPSYYKMEGQPISLLEGLASGDIIVTTSHAGIPDIISSVNGFLISPKSPQELAQVLENISKDLDFYINLFSQKNFEYASSEFTEEIFVKRILNVMELC